MSEDAVERFMEEDVFKDIDRELLLRRGLHGGFKGDALERMEHQTGGRREIIGLAVSVFSARSAQRHARAMRCLTWMLLLFAAVQACVAGVAVLAAVAQVVATFVGG
jgi:hypothetical protein